MPPIAAVREGATLPPSRMAAHSHNAGIVVMVASLAAIAPASSPAASAAPPWRLLLGGGVLGLFAGIALLAPRLVKPLARVVGWPARRAGGVAGELAGANAVRNPGRTASTAAALMIGLTLVTVVAVLGAGITAATKTAITDQVHADYVVDGKEDAAVPGRRGRQARGDAGRQGGLARPLGHRRSCRARRTRSPGSTPPRSRTSTRSTGPTGSERTLGQLGTDGAIVTKGYAEEQAPRRSAASCRSRRRRATSARSSSAASTTRRRPNPLLGDVSMSQQAFDKAFAQPKNSFTFLDADAGAADGAEGGRQGLRRRDAPHRRRVPEGRDQGHGDVLAMLYVLLGFSVIVSLFGMVNTMVLSVFERTREIGMLRTIGMTRRQARRMIRHESIITALIGAALGLGLGLFLAGLVTQAASMDGLPFTVPCPTLARSRWSPSSPGVGAAIMPARRASRLNVLEALQYE